MGGLDTNVVRIQVGSERDAEILGAGFMVTETRLVTCAHVLQGSQQEEIYAVFFPNASKSPRRAKVLWCGNPIGGADDVAILEIMDAPPGMQPIALAHYDHEDRFVAAGFPDSEEGSAAVRGRVIALAPNGLVQIETEGALTIEEGFSGTAVWCQRRGAALGMVVEAAEAEAEEESTVAFMTPASKLREALRLADLATVSPWLAGSIPGLVEICRDIQFERRELRGLYARCAPSDWPPLPNTDDTSQLAEDALYSLAEAPHQSRSGAFPLLQFVRLLIDLATVKIAQELKPWLEQARRDFGEEEPVPAPTLNTEPAGQYYVLVKIEIPSWEEVSPGREISCQIGAYLVGGQRSTHLFDDKSTVTAEQAGASLYRILLRAVEAIEEEGVDPGDIQFEFLLPISLLGHDVDRWELQFRFEAVPVGANHPVVVRSLERDMDCVLRGNLIDRWHQLHVDPHHCCSTLALDDLSGDRAASAVCFSTARTDRSLHTTLKQVKLICATLLWTPQERDRMLGGLIQAGVPIVLWMRQEMPAREERYRFFRGLIENKPLSQLPADIHQLRMEAANAKEEHPGHHLTLLWDDPTRPFPDRGDGSPFSEPEFYKEPES